MFCYTADMKNEVIEWDIYEITSAESSLNGVMLRGRIRKLAIENNLNVLVENTEDVQNGVRFAVTNTKDADLVIEYLHSIIKDVEVELRLSGIVNPVISKLKVNDESRYKL